MKAILTDDVSGTGYRGEHVEIRGGFMRNFLFPEKRAIYATDENRRMYEAVDRVRAVGAAPSQGGGGVGGLCPLLFGRSVQTIKYYILPSMPRTMYLEDKTAITYVFSFKLRAGLLVVLPMLCTRVVL